MTDVWSGDVLLADETVISDITLSSSNVASSVSIPPAPLRFLATVDTARIPLYLAAGQSLDVWAASEATEKWFQSVLLSNGPSSIETSAHGSSREWWACARAQSPIGVLAQVDRGVADANGPRITEILFYATVAASAQAGLPTPPSSSPEPAHAQTERLPELRVHALPLSSDLLHQSSPSGILPSSPTRRASRAPADVEWQFLPPLQVLEPKPSSPKRKRDIFDEAALARKRARGKGGEGVAAAAAKAQDSRHPFGHRKSLSIDTKAIAIPDCRPGSANGVLTRPPSRQLSRSPSLPSDHRPLSRKGPIDSHAKRSALSQVTIVPLEPEEPTLEMRNKEALSRVVMAAMRMHGLQQRKKNKSRRGSVAPSAEATDPLDEEAAAAEAAKDEEYKLIYHQTFKGATLALRKHISTKALLNQLDRLRDVVERLLLIFCTDPLAPPLQGEAAPNSLATPGGKASLGVLGSSQSHYSPFDLPSGARISTDQDAEGLAVHTGSPVSKRKLRAEETKTT